MTNGEYKKAIEAFTRKLRREQSSLNYSGRAEAFLRLQDYDRALADFYTASAVHPYSSTHWFERVGVVQWLARRENAAAGTWLDLVLKLECGKIQYTDGAGGVEPGFLLWFASVRLGSSDFLDAARRLLKKKVQAKCGRNWTIENWPGPIAKFLLGMFTESQLRERISDVPIVHEQELCQAEFYLAVHALQEGHHAESIKGFRKAARLHEGNIENEYDLAQRESRRRPIL